MLRLDVDNHIPQNCQFHVRVLCTSSTEEIVQHVKMRVNPHVGLVQNHEGHNV
jgi:hypothetical protein